MKTLWLLLLLTSFPAFGTMIGSFPGLSGLIEKADAILVLRMEFVCRISFRLEPK